MSTIRCTFFFLIQASLFLHSQGAFYGIDNFYNNFISIDAETGVLTNIGRIPLIYAFSGGNQCVSDPVNKILYFAGSTIVYDAAVVKVDLTTGNAVSALNLRNFDCCNTILTFISENKVLAVGPSKRKDDTWIFSIADFETNTVIELTQITSSSLATYSPSAIGTFDPVNNFAWLLLSTGDFQEDIFGLNMTDNSISYFNNTYANQYLAYSEPGGFIVGLSTSNIVFDNKYGTRSGYYGLSKFTSTEQKEDLYAYPVDWNSSLDAMTIDPTQGELGTIYTTMRLEPGPYNWVSIDVATGTTLTQVILNGGSTSNPPYGCVVYTN